MAVCRATVMLPATLLGSIGVMLAPLASAAPQPGDSCSVPGATSADGTLSCSGQSSTWMHVGLPIMQPGQPCTRPGDVTYTTGEGIVTCERTGSGLVWV